MPGKSFKGSIGSLDDNEQTIEQQLRNHVQFLASSIGQRNSDLSLEQALGYIKKTMKANGYESIEQPFEIGPQKFKNLECTLKGSNDSNEVLIVGAHYDSVVGSTGANDNGSGVAATLELARLFAKKKFPLTVKFVFFTNEEPPYFRTREMGSYAYAQYCKEHNYKIKGLIVLETIGYYTDTPNSQKYPLGLDSGYPTTGNFIAFVGNEDSKKLVQGAIASFRSGCKFPSEAIAAPNWIMGVDWSDQYWFWKEGVPAVMITDTALYRYRYYHTMQDTPDKLVYSSFARVVSGLAKVIEAQASGS